MKKILFILSLLIIKTSFLQAQTTDIRPNNVNYPILTTAGILALNASDGLRQGTTVYNSELKKLVIYDGCEWSMIESNYVSGQNPHQELVAPVGQNNSNFGSSMEIHEKILVVGANSMDVGANVDQGEVYVYRKNGCFWQYFATLPDAGGTAGNQFGLSVDIKPYIYTNDQLLIAVAGTQRARTYILTFNPSTGDPIGIATDQLIVNSHTTPFQYIKVGNQPLDDELVITHGNQWSINYINTNTYLQCNSATSPNNKIVIYRRISGSYSVYYTTGLDNIFSQGVTIPNVSVGRRVFYAKNSCNYWSSTPGTYNTLNRLDYSPSPGYIPYGGPLPNISIFPFLDLDYNGKYSQIAIGDRYGRNKSIKILTVSLRGTIESEENILESNVYECLGFTPTTCINGSVIDADYYGSTLSISNNKLIVGAPFTELGSMFSVNQKGAIYIYKKKGVWGLEKIITGISGQGIGNFVASTDKNYVYSQTNFNTGQGKVYVGEW
jgi:FG-GAP repeat